MISEYMKNRLGLKNGTVVRPEKKKKPIAQQSEKMKVNLKAYKDVRAEFMAKPENKLCGAKLKGCRGKAVEVHHKIGRGSNLVNVDTFLAVCRNCHNLLEKLDAESREKGLKGSRITKPVKK